MGQGLRSRDQVGAALTTGLYRPDQPMYMRDAFAGMDDRTRNLYQRNFDRNADVRQGINASLNSTSGPSAADLVGRVRQGPLLSNTGQGQVPAMISNALGGDMTNVADIVRYQNQANPQIMLNRALQGGQGAPTIADLVRAVGAWSR